MTTRPVATAYRALRYLRAAVAVAPVRPAYAAGVRAALVVVALARYVGHVPITALASILLVVGWRLFDWEGLRYMWRTARFEVGIFVATAAGILLTDFVIGVLIGVLLALVSFAHDQRELVRMQRLQLPSDRQAVLRAGLEGVRVLRLEGPLFFASQAKIDSLFDNVDGRAVIIDLADVPTLDTSGARALVRSAERLTRKGTEVWLTSLSSEARTMLAPMVMEAEGHLDVSDSPDEALRSMARARRGAGGDARWQGSMLTGQGS